MAYCIGDDIDLEIQTAFTREQVTEKTDNEQTIKKLFKEHKKLTIKYLNRKWNISSLESHITFGVIPRGLRERVVPAEHLYTPRFMEKWKAKCIEHGLSVIQLIVDEEKIQLDELKAELEQSSKELEPLQNEVDFEKHNSILRKEIEKT